MDGTHIAHIESTCSLPIDGADMSGADAFYFALGFGTGLFIFWGVVNMSMRKR